MLIFYSSLKLGFLSWWVQNLQQPFLSLGEFLEWRYNMVRKEWQVYILWIVSFPKSCSKKLDTFHRQSRECDTCTETTIVSKTKQRVCLQNNDITSGVKCLGKILLYLKKLSKARVEQGAYFRIGWFESGAILFYCGVI